ncbi:hypothetical protein [Actinoplanes sp. L3-i22]|uniref:hypothetical protein n=1 Tax=Actinoplanes sp. L3-i22 TaxID=2836373 RepID=UPI001C743BDE|nr:hypothetical protein [Actinoplanes sp. L3-i22]BCY10964.1 hypothetical protein L3i22_060520 [Actinoplanes sp. L3-i22]
MSNSTAPAAGAADEPGDAARIARLRRLRSALDGADRQKTLAGGVTERLDHLWRTGGQDHATARGIRPDYIQIRERFIRATLADELGPTLPRLLQTQGLQVRLQLLLMFDAQCRYHPGMPVHNVRSIARRADDQFAGWRELVLADVQPSQAFGGPDATSKVRGALRRRQITEALVRLEDQHLVTIPRHPKGSRRYDDFQLLSEEGSREHPPYTGPRTTVLSLPRHFFTSGWVWVLSDTEIATYLMLRHMRAARPAAHADSGVFVTSGDRETLYRQHRSTWRSADMLYRLRLIDRMPTTGRNFRTGKLGNPKIKDKTARKPLVRYKINDDALQDNALATAWQVLTDPSTQDVIRRDHGPLAEKADPSVSLLFSTRT